jgi:putative endonuclease
LEALGYRIIAANHRTRTGEIDLIAIEDGRLVFVEVRTRRGVRRGSPAESVVGAKAERLAALAEEYAAAHPELPGDLRVDVVSVLLTPEGVLRSIEVIRNAVTGD